MILIIVITTLTLAGAYGFLWWYDSAMRERIERPKYRFLEQVQADERQRSAAHGHYRAGGND